MKLIIAGGRDFSSLNSFGFIDYCITRSPFRGIKEIVSGCAEGIDAEGEHWASHRMVRVKKFPADWKKHGKKAGPLRNKKMAEYADALLLIWDGESKGSSSMRKEAKKAGIPIFEVILREAE